MSAISDRANRAGLRLMARTVVAPAMRRIARIRTDETAKAVNVQDLGQRFNVRAGYPTGAWGWTPIQALMFDNNKRHPLYGNKRYWYHQGNFPITEMTMKFALKFGVKTYSDEALDIMLSGYGFK